MQQKKTISVKINAALWTPAGGFMAAVIHSSTDNRKHIGEQRSASDSSDSPALVLQLEVGGVDALGVDPLQVSAEQQRRAGIAAQQGLVGAARVAAGWRRSSREREGVREQKSLVPANNHQRVSVGRRPSTTQPSGAT